MESEKKRKKKRSIAFEYMVTSNTLLLVCYCKLEGVNSAWRGVNTKAARSQDWGEEGGGGRWQAVSSRLDSRKISRKNSRLAHLLESSAVISGHSRIVELSLLTWIMSSIIFRALGRGFPERSTNPGSIVALKPSPPPHPPTPSRRRSFERGGHADSSDSGVEHRENEPLTNVKKEKR